MEDQKKNPQISQITILDIVLIFLKRKKFILITTSVVFVISVILYFFVFDLIYYSEASIKSSGKSGSILSSLESGLPDVGALDELGLGGGKAARELAVYENILTSRRCIEPLIDKFNLVERDKYQFKEDAILGFVKEKMKLDEDKLSGVLSVGIYDKDPKLAKEMVEFLLAQLDKINIELNVQNAKNNREFVEQRYFQAKLDLTKAEDSLKAFQVIYGIAPDLQVKAATQTAFTIESEMKAEEVKLDVLKKILSPDQVEVKTQEAKVNSLRDQISKIQTSTDLSDLMSLGNSAQVVMSYLRLEREVEIQSKILSFILPIYEQAKIDEKKETPTIIVLDKPYVAEKKVKPKRLLMIMAWTFAFFFITLVLAIFLERAKVYRNLIKSMRNAVKND